MSTPRIAVSLAIIALVFPFLAAEPRRGVPAELPALESLDLVPDSASVRSGIADLWLLDRIDAVAARPTETVRDGDGLAWRISAERMALTESLAVVVTPEISGSFPVPAQGTWALYRSRVDGMPEQIKIYPRDDATLFIRIRPDGPDPMKGRALLDVLAYGGYVRKDVPLGVPFIRLYTLPFDELVSMTRSTVPWELFDPDPTSYSAVREAVDILRSRLPSLIYLDDGAFNERGEPVLIVDGSPQDPRAILEALPPGAKPGEIEGGVNCSGFAKWVVDGIVFPRAGSRLRIEPLKGRTPSPETHFTEPFRESRDLFFALDWTRNLAAAAVSLNNRRTTRPADAGVDVSIEPFALTTTRPTGARDAVGFAGYQTNVGYQAEYLKALLFILASREPGHCYLGAISRERGDPQLRQYHHVAVFFPYFDEGGRFRVAVFESAVETPFETFVTRNAGAFINLSRVKLPESGYFQP
ncbi:MAG TPA: hypothetical protein PLU93_05895 [Treponemataceae bacterium]|jgi:hypothetical protein|nr:hypothetical protein [Treponemataceae bacterium]